MKNNRFIKLKIIWAIIKGRTVIYRCDFITGNDIMLRTDKACIVDNHFVGDGIKITDYKGDPVIG